jgi:hypothetical protein
MPERLKAARPLSHPCTKAGEGRLAPSCTKAPEGRLARLA